MKEKINKLRSNKIAFSLTIFSVLLILISLGSAILSSTLNIGGKAKIKENSWVIYFDEIRDISASQRYEVKPTIVDLKKTRIDFDAKLDQPGDYLEFYVDTVNDGTIDAAIDSIDLPELTDEQKKYIEFRVIDTSTGLDLKRCDTLLAGERKEVKVILQFKEGLELNEYPKEAQELSLSFAINYAQHPIDGCNTTPKPKKYKLYVIPNGGTYLKRTTPTRVALSENEEYTTEIPTRKLYNFDGWEVVRPNGEGDYEVVELTGEEDFEFNPINDIVRGNWLFKMGTHDTYIRAKWIENDYVARIEDTYYTTIQAAFDSVDGNNPKTGRKWTDNTVWLLRDTTEYPTNEAHDAFTFNLDAHTVTGSITNTRGSNITMVNGRVETENIKDTDDIETQNNKKYAFKNYGILNVGVDEGIVEVENSIALVGNSAGLYTDSANGAEFNFYDGYLEGISGFVGEYNDTPTNYFVFSEHRNETNRERVYLVRDPSRAVAKTYVNGVVYRYNLQDAFNAIKLHQNENGKEREKDYKVDAIRNFEAAYPLSNDRNIKIVFDLVDYTVRTGDTITNNGDLDIINSKENRSELKPSVTITNNGNLIVTNVNLTATVNKDVILNTGNLKVNDSIVHTDNSYGIKNITHGTVELNENVILVSDDSCGLYNSSDSLEITAGKIYCFVNTGTATVSGSNTEYITFLKKTQPNPRYPEYNPAIRNSGIINFNNGKVTTDFETSMIINSGTFNFTDGLIHSEYLSVDNSSGTFNVKGSELTSTRTPIKYGTVVVDGGDVKSETTNAIVNSSVYVKNGNVYTDEGIAIAGSSNVYVSGGTVRGTTTAINVSGTVSVTGGLVTSPDLTVNCGTFESKGGQVISENDTAVNSSNAIIKGTAKTDLDEGTSLVVGKTNGIITNNFTMEGGKITSTEGIGVTIKSTGLITGGFIEGDTYGVLSKDTLTLGADDETISSETPVLMGELYGLYIEGETTNFFDGILKGQVDGYYGPITGTPLGGVVFEGEEDLQKVSPGVVNHFDKPGENTNHYETDFIDRFNDWLRIGDAPYNTLNAASAAVEDGGEATIIVTRDANVLFAQKFIDDNRNKHITLDLNGHTITTTQNIINYTNLTIIDSSKNGQVYDDTGSGPALLKVKKNDGIINEQLLTINDGKYESITEQFIINKVSETNDDNIVKGVIINGGTFNVNKYVIQNGVWENGGSRSGYLLVNGINVETSKTFINNSYGTNVINGTKNNTTSKYTTEVHSSENAINNEGTVVINGGFIEAQNRIISGGGSVTVNEIKNINLDDDEQVAATYLHAINNRAINVSYYGNATINGGTIKADKDLAVYGEYYLTVNGGHIEGTRGLYNTCHTISWWNSCIYGDVNITGGKIVGTTGNGVTLTGDADVNKITGGEIIGKTTGVANNSELIIGTKGGELNIESPILRGIDEYGLTNTKYVYFYDGILMGKKKDSIENSSHNGLISEVEDATMVVRDFKFIDRVEYQTEYLRTQGDWLRVGDKTYNTVDKASAAVTAEDNTIYVIADTHIAFKQKLESSYNTTFDLNGHSVTFTQSINVASPTTFVGNGLFNNKRTDMIVGNGQMTFNEGSYSSDRGFAVISNNKLVMNGGSYHSKESSTIQNNGTFIFEDGEIISDAHYAVDNNGTFTMNHGEIKTYGAIDNDGTFTIKNNARIEGTDTYTITSSGTVNVEDDAVVHNEKTNAITAVCRPVNINGGTVESTTTNAITIGYSSSCGSATLNVSDGTIIGKTNGVVNTNTGNSINVTGGHIIGRENNGLNTYCTTNILGGLIEGNVYGVYVNGGTTTIGEDEGGIPRIDTPVLKGGLYGLYISNPQEMTVNFYDGILKGKTWAHYNDVTNIPDRTNIVYGTETIEDELYQTAYLFKEGDIARNTRTDVIYNNLQDAINEAEVGDTVELINNVPLFYQLVNENNITLDLNGHFISTNKNITNRGTLKIVNSAETESKIETSLTTNLITNLGTLEVDNVTLRNVSASYYVINSTGEVKLNNTTIDSIYGVSCNNKLDITNSNIKATQTAINNTGELNITGGTYQGGSYSVYSNSGSNITINGSPVIDEESNLPTDSDTLFKGTFYTTGNNNAYITGVEIEGDLQDSSTRCTTTNSLLNGRYYCSGGTSSINTSNLKRALTNNSNLTINDSYITGNLGEWIITGGTTNVNNTKIELNSSQSRCNYYSCYPYDGVENSGTLIFDNSIINIDKKESLRSESRGIYNSGTLKLLNNTILNIGMPTNKSISYKGILTAGSGTTLIEDSKVNVEGGSVNYGIYVDNTNASATIKTGEIKVVGAPSTYGAYINTGTFTMGEYDGRGIDGIVDIENPNPNIISSSASRGIGVKKINGSFNFYDGKILASKFTKPETTTHVEYNYEVTTYVDEETGYEYAWLEFMLSDYEGETVAKIGDTHYRSVQDAINKVEPDQEILLLKSTAEDLYVNGDRIVKINLNNHSITTHLVNNGSLNIYNGSLQNFDLTVVENNGTLIMGQDDGKVSSTNVRIISEVIPVINNGTFKMYDGYLEGNPSIEGSVNEIAEYARLHTKKDSQSEKKYLQSLSPEAIMAGETDLILTINPNGGIYNNSKEELVTYLKYQEEYELDIPTKNACDFVGWEVSDDVLTGNIIKMNVSDVIVTAKWEVSERAVAKVGNEYFESLQEALDYASDNLLVELIKDTNEDITNNSNVTLDLGGHKVTGAFTNNGILKILNGEIENPDGIGIVNNKSLNLGENDGDVSVDSVRILGTTVGIEQNGRFNFYDGYIEGDIALIGKTDSVPKGYFLYNERDTVRNQQKVYLIGNPENAVAVIEDGGTQYFFSLQDAINTANVTGSEIFIVRDFEATYPITIPEDADILINMNSYNITTGNNITNNGTLKIYDTSEEYGSITSARTIVNNGNLTIEEINITQNSTSNNAINSTEGSTLTIKNSKVEAKAGYAVNSEGTLSLEGNYTLKSNTYGLLNKGNDLTIIEGNISGIETYKNITVEEGTTITGNADKSGILVRNASDIIINGGTITSTGGSGIQNTAGNVNVTVNGGTISAKQALYCNQGTANYVVNDGTITASGNSAIQMQKANCNLEVNGGDISSSTHSAIYFYETPHIIKITGGNIVSTSGYGINYDYGSNTMSTIEMTGGTITGSSYGVHLYGAKLNMSGGELKTTSTNKDHVALYINGYSGATISGDAFINSPHASGIWATNNVTIKDNARVLAGASNAYGFYTNGSNLTLEDNAKIETTGVSSSAILLADNSNNPTININGGEVISENVGINTSTNGSTRTININFGRVIGKNYGIYQTSSGSTINMGSKDEELSTEVPYVSGGLYGIYKTAGSMNFYNGRLRGYNYGYNDTFNNVLEEHEIAKTSEASEQADISTSSVTNVSEMPMENTPKIGNGYAKITYIGETSDACTNGSTYTFDYTASEETFSPVCAGTYKLEVWGAQGGGSTPGSKSSSEGGAGGYSTGEIELNIGEILYINVGGAGKYGSGDNLYGGPVGGYNGGGSGGNYISGSGGGATHIATQTGLLKELSNNKTSVLIVAGGGGGADDTSGSYGSSNDGRGGSGGGYMGGAAYRDGSRVSNNYYNASATSDGGCGMGGTQEKGYAFGQGESVNYNTDTGGAGGGWYGGYVTNYANGGAGGGSGYIGRRLTNAKMYGYNVPATHDVWINNFLVTKEDFIQVGDNTYNSINKAQAAIEENGTGTMILLKDVEVNELSTITENKTVTFDLNGHELKLTRGIVNKSDLTIIDSSNGKTSKIDSLKTNAIVNRAGSLTVDGTYIKSSNSAIYVADTSTTITLINGTKLEGTTGLSSDIASTEVIVNNSTITGTKGIILNKENSTITIDDSTISGTSRGIQTNGQSTTITLNTGSVTSIEGFAVDIRNHYSKFIMGNGTVTGKDYGIYNYGQKNAITINNGTVTATNGDGIRNDSSYSTDYRPTITINGGLVQGSRYGVYNYYCDLVVAGDGEVRNTSSNRDYYAVYSGSWGGVTLKDNAFVNAPNASGVRTESGLTIKDNARIYAGASNGFGVYSQWLSANMTGGTIEAPGIDAYGVYSPVTSEFTFNLKGGTIKAGNTGIRLENSNNYTRVLNVTGGSIEGGRYGIYQTQNYTTTLGVLSEPVSDETPYITGGQYAIYKTAGTINFYSGKLRGYHNLDATIFNNTREKMRIATDEEIVNDEISTNTLNTYNASENAEANKAKIGNGYARITYLGLMGNTGSIETEDPEIVESITCQENIGKINTFSAIKNYQEYDVDCAGQYKIELWGAQGGYRSAASYGGNGGYVSGIVNLENRDHLYVMVGSSGNNGGYNGGGTRTIGHGGGGATDIRLDVNDLYSRIMVAGGGGSDGASSKPGGAAGGLTGESRNENYGSGGTGATQTSGGTYRGTFGIGGDGVTASGGYAGAGGAGWYGGGGANPDGSGDDDRGGGGGSSYIFTSTSEVPTGYNVDSRFQATNTVIKGGRDTIPTYSGEEEMVGNTGNGYAKITFLSAADNAASSAATHDIRLETSIGELDENLIEYTAGDRLGTLPIPVVDNDNYIFDGYYLDKDYTRKVTENTIVSSSAVLYAKFIFDTGECNTLEGKTYEFGYKGEEEQFQAYCPGVYQLETWGASGGKALCDGAICGTPGYGGYSKGNTILLENQVLFINVGGQGASGSLTSCAAGGYNGGGKGTNDGGGCGSPNDNEAAGGGGGATHIASKSGLLSSLEENKDKILIVAGGGGGTAWSYTAGSGGGHLGGRTLFTTEDVPSQTSGYAFGQGTNGTGNKQPGTCTNEGSSCNGVAGGGGGYYGGYSHDVNKTPAATGGSGHLNQNLTDAVMYQYHMDSQDVFYINYLTDKEGFLEVNGVPYNNFEDAINAIEDEGTIKVILSTEVQEVVTIPAGKNITLDMNDLTLTMTQPITNQGTLHVTNTGLIENKKETPIINQGNLTVTNTTLKSNNGSAIYGNSGTGTITINGAKLSGYNGIYTDVAQRIIVNSGTIEGNQVGIYTYGDNSSLTIKKGSINGRNYGIRNYGQGTIVTIEGGTIEGSVTGIFDDRQKDTSKRSIYNITGGKIIGGNYGVNTRYSTSTFENTEIITNASSRDYYALYCNDWASCTVDNGTVITSQNASGIYNNGGLVVNGGEINANLNNSYGIYQESTSVTLNGGNINTPGLSAIGIYENNGTLTLNSGNINSGNNGIVTANNTNTKNINIYDCNILGKTYGIYQNQKTNLILGDSTKDVSITNPYIEGGINGLYSNGGTMSFYSGRLKGNTKAYTGMFNNIKDGYEIFENYEEANSYLTKDKTYSVEENSSTATPNTPKAGNGYAKITYKRADSVVNNDDYEIVTEPLNKVNCNSLVGKEYIFESIGEAQVFAPECSGEYKVELWGAQGGYRSSSANGGKGAYTRGYINIENIEQLFVYVGSSGNNGGYNGGGSRTLPNYGGGATDIRTTSSLYSRIMVAAGGGSDGASGKPGGAGGALTGESRNDSYGSGGQGGTQEHGGDYRGTFGQGGSGVTASGGYGGAGGGGWYGGGGVNPDGSGDDDRGGGGGSSFIYNDTSILPTGYLAPDKYKFTNFEYRTGNQTMPSYDGTSEITGNTGNGYAKITFTKSIKSSTYKVKLVSNIGTIENAEIRYRSGTELGEIPGPVVNDSSLTFEGWYLDQEFTKKIAPTYKVRANLTLYAKFNITNEYCEGLLNEEYVFDYTGNMQTFTSICPGSYILETWGAQGGNTSYNSNSNTGGYGAYSKGEITLSPNEKLYIYVGGKGQSINYNQAENQAIYDESNGFNGGGNATYSTDNSAHAGGGGATHIATRDGLLSSLSRYKDNLLIVAGGGGGASTHANYPDYSGDGGSGGGYSGGSGITSSNTCYNYGTGGTQSSGGSYVACSTDGRTDRNSAPSSSLFGQGSNYTSNASDKVYSGGGGGYYGGESGYHAPGGGGSGYTGNSRLSNTAMYGYKVNPKYDVDSNIAYLVLARNFIKNINKDTEYSNLQVAFDSASEGDTLQLLDDNVISYVVTINANTNVTLDLNGHNLSSTKTFTNNGIVNIVNSDTNNDSKIFSGLSSTLITNNGTIDITGVEVEAYNAFDNSNGAVLNITNETITARNQAISNAGELNITTSTISGTNTCITSSGTVIVNESNISGNVAINNNNTVGDVRIIKSNITSSNRAINNTGTLTILDNSIINGNNYAIYSSSIKPENINNSTLSSNNTVIYKNSTSITTIEDTNLTGYINVNNSGGTLNITNNTLTGYIYNNGKLNLNNITLNYTSSSSGSIFAIENNGNATLNNNNINIISTYTGTGNNYDLSCIYNKGTITSSNNHYKSKNTNNIRTKYLVGIQNDGVLTSTTDDFELGYGNTAATIYNSTNSTATITGLTSEAYQVNTANGIYNNKGTLDITSSTFDIRDTTTSRGVYIKTGNITTTDTNYTITTSTNGYGTYIENGTLNLITGRMDINATETAYGIQMLEGTLTLGVEDGKGTDSADVSITDPYIKAVGTTGIGVSMGNGTFNYYDGYIMGSTSPRAQGDITTSTDLNYQVVTRLDDETGYNYCILEFIK